MSNITLKEIQEKNKLIALFLGWREQTDPTERFFGAWFNTYGDRETQGVKRPLLFHSSWDRLMPLVKKISDIKSWSINATLEWLSESQDRDGLYDIEDVFNSVVEFIEFYNRNK